MYQLLLSVVIGTHSCISHIHLSRVHSKKNTEFYTTITGNIFVVLATQTM